MGLDHVLLHSCPTTDSNTSAGVISVTLNMASATEECRELSGNLTLSGVWSPCIFAVLCFIPVHKVLEII